MYRLIGLSAAIAVYDYDLHWLTNWLTNHWYLWTWHVICYAFIRLRTTHRLFWMPIAADRPMYWLVTLFSKLSRSYCVYCSYYLQYVYLRKPFDNTNCEELNWTMNMDSNFSLLYTVARKSWLLSTVGQEAATLLSRATSPNAGGI